MFVLEGPVWIMLNAFQSVQIFDACLSIHISDELRLELSHFMSCGSKGAKSSDFYPCFYDWTRFST